MAYPFVDKKQRRATPEDKLKQQRSYYRYLQWLASCNLTEEDFLDNLRKASERTVRRNVLGVIGIPKLLQNRIWNKRKHALLACRALAYQRAASVAGHSVGGETMAQEARAYLTELLSSTNPECLENFNLVPKELIPNDLLQSPSTHAVDIKKKFFEFDRNKLHFSEPMYLECAHLSIEDVDKLPQSAPWAQAS